MEQTILDQLPEVQICAIGPGETDRAAPLLTTEAAAYLKAGEAFGLALTEEGEARAAACARLQPGNEAVLELVSLYVPPGSRRRGLGGTLLMELLEAAMEATDGGIRWVSAVFPLDAEGVEALLSRAGFRVEAAPEVVSWELTVGELAESPLLRRAAVPAGTSLLRLKELPNFHIRQLMQTLQAHWVDDLTVGELRQAHPEASYVLCDRQGKPVACAVISTEEDGGVSLSQFFAANGSSSYAMAVLRASAQCLYEQLPGRVVVRIPTLTNSAAKLVRRLLPSVRPAPLRRAVLDLSERTSAM